MMIHIDDDYADEILVANLANSYVMVKHMMLSGDKWHPEDIAAWQELLPAMEMVGNWYSTDFKAAIKAAKKATK
jgi:hypothetical protein